MVIFATEFTVMNPSYCKVDTDLLWILVVHFGRDPGVLFAFSPSNIHYITKIHRNMKKKNSSKELSYYGLYLLSYINENHPNLLSDTDFIENRADLAAAAYEQARLEEYTHEGAQELAMVTLMEGLHFSRYNTLLEVLWNEFEDELPQGDAGEFAFKLLPSLEEIFSKYPLSDDFAYTSEYDALYTELTGAIFIHIEAYGL